MSSPPVQFPQASFGTPVHRTSPTAVTSSHPASIANSSSIRRPSTNLANGHGNEAGHNNVAQGRVTKGPASSQSSSLANGRVQRVPMQVGTSINMGETNGPAGMASHSTLSDDIRVLSNVCLTSQPEAAVQQASHQIPSTIADAPGRSMVSISNTMFSNCPMHG